MFFIVFNHEALRYAVMQTKKNIADPELKAKYDFFFYCQPFRRYMFRSTIKDTRTAAVMLFSPLEVQSRELYNKNMIALTQITNSEIFAFITLPVFKILIPKVLFINRKDKRNLKSRLLFKKIANFTGKLLQNCK